MSWEIRYAGFVFMTTTMSHQILLLNRAFFAELVQNDLLKRNVLPTSQRIGSESSMVGGQQMVESLSPMQPV